MDNRQPEFYAALLERMRDELRVSLASARETTSPVAPDRAIGRLTRQEAIAAQQIALELKRRNEVRLSQVEAALQRIENGTFGLCAKCEEEISEARLKVRPETRLCIRCADRGSTS